MVHAAASELAYASSVGERESTMNSRKQERDWAGNCETDQPRSRKRPRAQTVTVLRKFVVPNLAEARSGDMVAVVLRRVS